MTSSPDRARSETPRGEALVSRVLTGGGGYPRRSGLAVACAALGPLATLVLLAVLFTGAGSWQFALLAPVVALAGAICALLALFRDWGRARLGVVMGLLGDALIALMAAAMLTQTAVATPVASTTLVLLVGLQAAGAILVLTAPRKGHSDTPRAVEPIWSAAGSSSQDDDGQNP